MQISSIGDSWNSVSQDTYISDKVVLADIFNGTTKEWSIDAILAADVGDQII